jgi:FkbM family methyltransferase
MLIKKRVSIQNGIYLNRMIIEARETYDLAKFLSIAKYPSRYFWRTKSKELTAVNLGANVGAFEVVYSRFFDKIIAVEPSSVCIKLAKDNLNFHGINNVDFFHAALTDVSGNAVPLYKVYSNGISESKDFTTTKFDPELSKKNGYQGVLGGIEENCNSITLLDVLSSANITQIDFLKVDIEGGEYLALMNQNLGMVTVLVAEIHYSFLGKQKVHDLVLHLKKFFSFLDENDEDRFLHAWPPPQILRMVNYSKLTPCMRLKLSLLLKIKILFSFLKRLIRKFVESLNILNINS